MVRVGRDRRARIAAVMFGNRLPMALASRAYSHDCECEWNNGASAMAFRIVAERRTARAAATRRIRRLAKNRLQVVVPRRARLFLERAHRHGES